MVTGWLASPLGGPSEPPPAWLAVPVQVPFWHVSVSVQALPSLHPVPLPLAGLGQTSVDWSQIPTSEARERRRSSLWQAAMRSERARFEEASSGAVELPVPAAVKPAPAVKPAASAAKSAAPTSAVEAAARVHPAA
jgi:hypothetical protein